MATAVCNEAQCPKTQTEEKPYYRCSKCGRGWCKHHGYEGKLCRGCGKGTLHH